MPDNVPILPKLYQITGSTPTKVYQLSGELFRLGREADCHAVLPDEGRLVSRYHAFIRRDGDQFRIQDGDYSTGRESHNGTYLNGHKLEKGRPIELKPGDQIKICQYTFVYDSPVIHVDLEDTSSTVLGSIALSTGSKGDRGGLKIGAEDLLKAVLAISKEISTTLSTQTLLERTLDCLFNLYPHAERGFILIRPEREVEELKPQAYRFRGETTRQWCLSRKVLERVLDRGEAILSQNTEEDSRFRESGSLAESEVRTMMCMPLLSSKGSVIGMVQLDTSNVATPFSQNDLDLLAALTGPVSLAVENARLHEKLVNYVELETEMRAASDVQKSLLPLERPKLAQYEFWDYYESTRWVGGDSYDYLRVSRGDGMGAGEGDGGAEWAITIADVAGKGLSAALFMARVATGIRYQFLQDRDPVRVVEALNRDLEDPRNPERFVTFALVMLDPDTHRIRMVNAGHWTPYLRRARTGLVERILDESVGYEPPLFAIPGWSYHVIERELEPGDLVFMVTDGVIEAFDANSKQYGEERLIRMICSGPVTANGTGMELIYDLRQHQGSAPQSDDIAIVSFRRIE